MGITNYADTVVFDGNKSLVAIRFGGYPETVLAMSDALFSGSKIALRLPKEKNETELTSFGGHYSRRLKAGDTASECVLKLNDDEKKEKDENPHDIYIFCKDESGLFTELDSKLAVPLIPEWEEYFIRELKDRKILKRLNVFSANTEFAAYAVTLKKDETEIAKVLTDGLKSGEISIPNARKDDTAFGDIETFTQYLNAFGKDIAKKIQATFKPVFNPAEESICPELNEVNEYIRQNTGYSLYEAQLAGAEAIKRQLKKEKMTMLVSGCGTGKTKIGSAALYAYQKSIGGGRRINVITCPSHVAKKWVRELYETVPDCIARAVSSITDIDRMYELYRTTAKPVFMVLSVVFAFLDCVISGKDNFKLRAYAAMDKAVAAVKAESKGNIISLFCIDDSYRTVEETLADEQDEIAELLERIRIEQLLSAFEQNEREVLTLLLDGFKLPEISFRLQKSLCELDSIMQNIRTKTAGILPVAA